MGKQLRWLSIWGMLGLVVMSISACLPPTRDLTIPGARIQISDDNISAKGDFAARVASLTLANEGTRGVTLLIFRLPDQNSIESVVSALQSEITSAKGEAVYLGGVLLQPGQARQLTFNLRPGSYLAGAFSADEARYTSFSIGEANPSKGAEPVGFVNVEMDDAGFYLPDTIQSGAFTWEITNAGQGLHEMELLKLNEGVSREQVLDYIQADTPAASPPYTVAEVWAPMSPGQTAWIRLDLEPGNYLAICLLPGHQDEGLMAEFSVVNR